MNTAIQNRKIDKTGPIGRVARIALGAIFLWLFINFATGYQAVVQPGNVVLYFWAFVGMYSHSLGSLIPPLSKLQTRIKVVLLLAAAALLLDFFLYQSWWGVPLAILLYGLAIVAFGILGVEHLLAGVMGYPGCESTAFYNLRHADSSPKISPCILWDPLDRWEHERSTKDKTR